MEVELGMLLSKPMRKAKAVSLPKMSPLRVVTKRRMTRRSFRENVTIARIRVTRLQNAASRTEMERMVP